MPSPIVRRGAHSWYARDIAPGDESPVNFGAVLGPWTEAKEAALLRWRAGVLSTRPRGRPAKGDECLRCRERDTMDRLRAEARAEIEREMGLRPAPAVALPVAAPAPVALPTATPGDLTPSALLDEWLAAEEVRLQKPTLQGLRSNVRRVVGDLGNDFAKWRGFWQWWAVLTTKDKQPMSMGSKVNIRDAVFSMLAWARGSAKWAGFANVVRKEDKPPRLTVKQRRERNPHGDPEENGTPFTVDEARSILAASRRFDVPLYMRLGILLGAHHAMAAADAFNFLTGKGVFVDRTNDPRGNLGLWWMNGRQKTNVMIYIPLAPTVVTAMEPYFVRDAGGKVTGVDLHSKVCVVRSWRPEFLSIRRAAGVHGLPQEDWARWRNTLRHQWKDVLKVADPVVKASMGQRVKQGGDIGTTYDSADPMQMVEACRRWDAVLSEPRPADAAPASASVEA